MRLENNFKTVTHAQQKLQSLKAESKHTKLKNKSITLKPKTDDSEKIGNTQEFNHPKEEPKPTNNSIEVEFTCTPHKNFSLIPLS